MSKNIPYNIIVASLENTATIDEQKELDDWLSSTNENREIFESIKKTWSKTQLKRSSFNPNIDPALTQTKKRIHRRLFIKRVSGIAAILLIGLMISTLFNPFDNDKRWQSVIAQQQEKIELPDGSIVVLSPGSEIKFPDKFEAKSRRVKIKGKAYFDVAHNKNQPFIVETNHTKTKVLGTKFTLVSDALDKDVLYLDEGKVEFSSLTWFGPKQLVKPGEEISLMNGKLIKRIAINDNLSTWATGKLTFKDIALIDLVKQLEDYYQTPITLSTSLINDLHFSGSITQTEAIDALQIIALTLQLKLSTDNQTLTLSL
ncbi:FecR family protein [Carboxylicivirga caseinilyticus]|uniref:FecR family protein n=1 Tax=Carboxylicivirga caseinilyticus TaxID=3417572 RepID=UPI003D33229E|nr:FecR domain-containing protein [Marinilabiliaceae bacterium A049]